LVSFPQYALTCTGETTPTARPLCIILTVAVVHSEKFFMKYLHIVV